jgi:hypothetical protein
MNYCEVYYYADIKLSATFAVTENLNRSVDIN